MLGYQLKSQAKIDSFYQHITKTAFPSSAAAGTGGISSGCCSCGWLYSVQLTAGQAGVQHLKHLIELLFVTVIASNKWSLLFFFLDPCQSSSVNSCTIHLARHRLSDGELQAAAAPRRVVGVRGHVFRSNFSAGTGQVFPKLVHGLVICLDDSGENIFWAKTDRSAICRVGGV